MTMATGDDRRRLEVPRVTTTRVHRSKVRYHNQHGATTMKANNGANVLDAIIGNAGTKTPHDVAVEAKITEASARVAALLSDMSAEKLCAYMAESFERAAFVAITSANTSIGASVQMAPNVATSLVPPKLAADQVRDAAKSVARADELSRTAVEWRKLEATFKSLLPNGGTIAVTV